VINPVSDFEFTMHSISPSLILGISQALFTSKTIAYQIHIKGEEWEFMKPISNKAISNMHSALEFIRRELTNQQ
jgi:hypothetical protein